MPRPVNADADATRRRILQSAITLFSSRGTGNTSIRDVARAASVSLAMVHYYFVSKDQLYDECIAAIYEEVTGLRTELESAIQNRDSERGLLAHAIATGYRFARDHRVAVKLLVRESVESGQVTERGQSVLFKYLDTGSQLLAAWLGRSAADLRLPLQSAVFLIARHAIQDDSEAAQVAGLEGPDAIARSVEAIEHHLVQVVLAMLGVSEAHPAATAR